jgi:biopolymer transport protein ExbB/TolQ
MSLAAATATATFVAVMSAVATIGSFLAYLYFVQRSNANAARDEALALAETRRQVIADLRVQLASLEKSRRQSEIGAEKRIRRLQRALDNARAEAREQAYQIQRLYAIGLTDVLAGVRRDLEAVPADVERALRRIRELLASVPPAA